MTDFEALRCPECASDEFHVEVGANGAISLTCALCGGDGGVPKSEVNRE